MFTVAELLARHILVHRSFPEFVNNAIRLDSDITDAVIQLMPYDWHFEDFSVVSVADTLSYYVALIEETRAAPCMIFWIC